MPISTYVKGFMIYMKKILTAVCVFVTFFECIPGTSANKLPTGPHSGNKSNLFSPAEDDIPIISDNVHQRRESNGKRRRSSRSSRIRRSSRKRGQESDADDDIPGFTFSDGNDYDVFYDTPMSYESERRSRRIRSRRRNRYQKSGQPSYGLGAHIDSLRTWTEAKTGFRLPRINVQCDPVTILKVRKAWSLPGVIFRIGADFETYRLSGGFWKFRACCEDKLIGGRFTVKEVQSEDEDGHGHDVLIEYSKSWMFASAGAAMTRFNLCAAYDIHTKQGGVRLGVRTESLGAIGHVTTSPFSGSQRFTIVPVLPLDNEDRFKLELKTNIDVPNPELVFGMDLEGQGSSVGIGGSVDVEVEELSLIASF